MDWAYLPRNAPESWKETWYLRNKDLIDKYRPDLLYFDGGIPYINLGLKLIAHYYNANKAWHGGGLEAVLNLKKTKVSGAYREGMCVQDLERSKLEGIKAEPWQTDTSIGTWFCRREGTFETPKAIIQMFVDIVSKNGNLLLNIPLLADGTLDTEPENLLTEMGKWMDINGEAILKTRPWNICGEGPTAVKQEYSEEIKESFTPKDFRFTTKDDVLYAICMDWPQEGGSLNIESLATGRKSANIAELRLLGYDGPVEWDRNQEGLKIVLPPEESRDNAFVFRIVFKQRT
jgi:alpha-L-fucosidase